MSYNSKYITQAHIVWAMENRVIITEGECGFGRPCVGITSGTHWVDWRSSTGAPDYLPVLPFYDGWIPDDAYHKYDCVAVLGQDDVAWNQLALWLDAIIEGGWIVLHEDHHPTDGIDLLFHGLTTVRLGKP